MHPMVENILAISVLLAARKSRLVETDEGARPLIPALPPTSKRGEKSGLNTLRKRLPPPPCGPPSSRGRGLLRLDLIPMPVRGGRAARRGPSFAGRGGLGVFGKEIDDRRNLVTQKSAIRDRRYTNPIRHPDPAREQLDRSRNPG
jgi:hypothetical protein